MIKRWIGVALVCALSACASLESSRAPGASVDGIKTAWVQRQPKDQRGIEKMIAAELGKRGITAASGPEEAPPAPVDAIVTYQDRWQWDITMYMMQLQLQLRDGSTRSVLATARVTRPSLQRKTPEGMVEEALTEIFKGEKR